MAEMMDTEGGGTMTQRSGKVDAALMEKAVDALLKWNASQKQKEKAQLLEDDQLLYVMVGMNKMPEKSRTNPYRVQLPHPVYKLGSTEVCLIISDRKHAKQKLDKKMAKEQIAKEGLQIAKVIPLSKLKKDYFGFEAKRKLCGSYDIFLADDRILGELPKLLGKTFYKKKKLPIPVNLTRAQWTGQITDVLNSSFLYLSGGTCSMVKIARVSQPREEIVENVKAVVEGVAEQIPKKWANIRAFFLKTMESVALPLYQSLPVVPLKIDLSEILQPEAKESLKSAKKEKRSKPANKKKLSKEAKEANVPEKEERSKEERSKEANVPVKKEKRVKEVKEANVPLKKEKTAKEANVPVKEEGEDMMDVIEETVVAEKSKKRKKNDVEGKRKARRKGAIATGA